MDNFMYNITSDLANITVTTNETNRSAIILFFHFEALNK